LTAVRFGVWIPPVIASHSKPKAKPGKDRRWTFDETVAELPESNQPTELWDGKLIMSPSPPFFHQDIVASFYKLLDGWVREHRLGKVGIAPLDMILTQHNVTQPDIFFVSNERLGILTDRLRGAVDLAVEVISLGSRQRDRLAKRDLYEQHGVKEYWIIDPEAQTVEVLFLEAGAYQLAGRWRPGERARSRLLPGFEIDLTPLFAES